MTDTDDVLTAPSSPGKPVMKRRLEEQSFHPLRLQLPRFLVRTDGEVGLGSIIKRATTFVGIQPCGGCDRRADALDRLLVFVGSQGQHTGIEPAANVESPTSLGAATPATSSAPASVQSGVRPHHPPAPTLCIDSPSRELCDEVDPVEGGCVDGSYPLQDFTVSGPGYGGTLQLMWSPNCQTNWARFTPDFDGIFEVSVERQDPHLRLEYPWWLAEGMRAGVPYWTDMVYAPGPAQACVNEINGEPPGGCTGYTR